MSTEEHLDELARSRERSQTRRALARRRRVRGRVDLAVGALLALAAVLLAPGLAIVALAALAVLACCAVSVVVSRLRTARRPRRVNAYDDDHAHD